MKESAPPSGNADLFAAVPLHKPGTAVQLWWEAAESVSEAALEQVRRAVVIVAHPDDECLGPGGLLALLSARGVEVQVIIVSDGAGSHAHDPGVDPVQLAAVRQAESEAAAEIMGTDAPVVLGFPDSDLAAHEEQIEAQLAVFLDNAQGAPLPDHAAPPPGSVAVLTHWRGDGHPDHEAVGRAAAKAVSGVGAGVALWEFPLWALHWDTPGGAFPLHRAVAVPLTPASISAKQRAAQAFTSQLTPWPPDAEERTGTGAAPVMPDHVVERLLTGPEFLLPSEGGGREQADGLEPLDGWEPEGVREPVDGLEHLRTLYETAEDPWDFEHSPYEAHKRQATLDALPAPRYRLCFEPGCSIGVLTEALAGRADQVIGWDPVERAVTAARSRIRHAERAGRVRHGQVRCEQREISVDELSAGIPEADLIVLSEVLYFIDHDQLAPIISGLCARAVPGAHVIAVHWRHPVQGWPQGGADTHHVLCAEPRLQHLFRQDEHPDYRIDVFETRR